MAPIGIVIVTFNSEREIGPCLDAAIRTSAEIVVIDNASSDGSTAAVARRNVRFIANAQNRGFAAAVNQGFAVLQCPYILLLNPDAVIQSKLDALREACDLPGAAAAGGQLIGADGQSQRGFMVRRLPGPLVLCLEALALNRLWPGNPANRRYRGLDLDYSKTFPAEQPAGAFLMVRRAVWQELGGLDEGFFPVWFEDVDFCQRLASRGYRVYYTPQAVAKHTGGHSIARITVEIRHFYWYRSLLRYSAKHFSPTAFRGLCLAVVTGSILRMILLSVVNRSLQPIAVFGKVVRLAGRCLVFGWKDEAVVPGSPV